MNTKDTTVGYVLGYNKGYMLGINNANPNPKPPLPPSGLVAWNDKIEIVGEDVLKNTLYVLEVIPFENYCSVHQIYENGETLLDAVKALKTSIGKWYESNGFVFIGVKESSSYYYNAYSTRSNCDGVATIGHYGTSPAVYIGPQSNYIASFVGYIPNTVGTNSMTVDLKYVSGSNCKAFSTLNHYWEIDKFGNTRVNGTYGDTLILPTMPPVTLNRSLWIDGSYGDSILCCLYAEKDWNVLRTNNGYYICFNRYAYKL